MFARSFRGVRYLVLIAQQALSLVLSPKLAAKM
jgi:hypothetical protein